jgi:hypothetical protein
LPSGSEHQQRGQDAARHESDDEVPEVRARHEEDRERHGTDDDRRTHVWLDDDQPGHDAQDDQERDRAVRESSDPPAFPCQPVRHVDHDGDFRQLAGLERRQRPQLEPARRTVLDHTQARHQHQHERYHRENQQQQRHFLPAVIVHAGSDDRANGADGDPGQLPREEVRFVVELVVRDDHACAVDHLRAEREQQRHRANQDVVDMAGTSHAAPPVAELMVARTAAAKSSPRCSKS